MTRCALTLLALAAMARAEPPACPIEAPALARLRAEHAAMNAAGVACLSALDAARVDRDRCITRADAAVADLARELAEASAQLDAAAVALVAPVPAARPWAFVVVGGGVAAAGGAVAHLAGAEARDVLLAAAGSAAGAALLTAALAWAGAL